MLVEMFRDVHWSPGHLLTATQWEGTTVATYPSTADNVLRPSPHLDSRSSPGKARRHCRLSRSSRYKATSDAIQKTFLSPSVLICNTAELGGGGKRSFQDLNSVTFDIMPVNFSVARSR